MKTKSRSDKVKYWISLSEYDLKTANAMLKSKRYLYVGFMCHQAMEKILKGHYTYVHKDNPPYIHNLIRLSELSGILTELTEEQKNFIFLLQPLNIEARYPQYKNAIFKSLTKESCTEILNNTKKLHKWVKKKLV